MIPEELWLKIFQFLHPINYFPLLNALPLDFSRRFIGNNVSRCLMKRRMECWKRHLLPHGSMALEIAVNQLNSVASSVNDSELVNDIIDLMNTSQLTGLLRRSAFNKRQVIVDLLLGRAGMPARLLASVQATALLHQSTDDLFEFTHRYLPLSPGHTSETDRERLLTGIRSCLLEWLRSAASNETNEMREQIRALVDFDREWLQLEVGIDFTWHLTRDQALMMAARIAIKHLTAKMSEELTMDAVQVLPILECLLEHGAEEISQLQQVLNAVKFQRKVLSLVFEFGFDPLNVPRDALCTNISCTVLYSMHGVPANMYENEMLDWHVRQGNLRATKLLVKRGADPTARQGSIIAYSLENGSIDLLRMLLDASGGKEYCRLNGCKLLLLAALHGQLACARLLIGSYAAASVINSEQRLSMHRALEIAASKNNVPLVRLLLGSGVRPDTSTCRKIFCSAAARNYLRMMRLFIGYDGVDTSECVDDALQFAVENNHEEAVEFILQNAGDKISHKKLRELTKQAERNESPEIHAILMQIERPRKRRSRKQSV